MARWSCDEKTVGTGRECGTRSPAGRSRNPANGQHAAGPPSRGDVTAVSPRLPSGALLALTAAMTAATVVGATLPAWAGAAAPGGPAAVRAGTAPAERSDRVRAQEWWLGNLHVPQAWQVSRGAGITVAVLSSGVEATHPDLSGSVVTGPDFTGSGEVPGAPSWAIEGTSTASIIAGHGDNVGQASGIIGVAPAARILSIRVVLDATDPLNANPADVGRLPAAIAAGIRYAARHGAQVIDLPLDPASLASDGAATGGLSAAAGGSAAERAAVNYALGKGSVLVAPAGDNGEDGDEPTFPASYPGVIALGAVDRHFVGAPFSIRQSYVALTAPGVNLTTASPPSGYRNMSTTDAASAIAAGVAALIRSRYPALTGSQVRQALLAGGLARPPSATTPGDGAGTVDALKAVEAAALIAAPRASASAPSTSPAKAQAPPGRIRPAEGHPATAILSRAKAVLRDAAMAAAMLIVLLLASLIGIRVRRRRAQRATLPAAEPRTLLSAPSGPLAAGARHTRAAAEERAAAAHAAAPGAARWRRGPPPPGGQDGRIRAHPSDQGAAARTASRPALPGVPQAVASGPPPRILPVPGVPPFPGPASPGGPGRPGPPGAARSGGPIPGSTVPGGTVPVAAVPGGRTRRKTRNRGRSEGRSGASSRVGAHGLPVRVMPVPRTVTRAEVSAPGGPPWDPAPMPEGEVPNEPVPRAPDPFALFAPSAPATSAPWDADQPGPVADPGPIAPPGHTAPPPGHVARSGLVPPHHQVAPPGRPAPRVPPQPGLPYRRGQLGPGGVPGSSVPGSSVPGGDAPGRGDVSSPRGGWSDPNASGMAPLGGPPGPPGAGSPIPPAGPAGPIPPAGRLRSGGPVPSADPASPGAGR
jgi:subtilisin family serine protease